MGEVSGDGEAGVTALILGKALCLDCQAAAAWCKRRGYDAQFRDIDRDVEAYALHQQLDGGDTVPVVILRGWIPCTPDHTGGPK